MSASSTVRLSGAALLAGPAIVFITALISALAFVGSDPTGYANDALFVPVNVVSFVGAFLALLGLPIALVALYEQVGVLGAIGIALLFLVGLMLAVFFPLLSALVLPYIVQHAPSLVKGNNGPPAFFPFFIVSAVAQVAGAILLAIPILRGRTGQRWVGVALVLSALGVVINIPISSGSSVILSLISSLGELLLMVAFMGIGYRLLGLASSAAAELTTSPPGGRTQPG